MEVTDKKYTIHPIEDITLRKSKKQPISLELNVRLLKIQKKAKNS